MQHVAKEVIGMNLPLECGMLTGRMAGSSNSRGATPRLTAAGHIRDGAFRTRIMPYQPYSIAAYPAAKPTGAAHLGKARPTQGIA